MGVLEKMEISSMTQKNMLLPIREGIAEAFSHLRRLRGEMNASVAYLEHFEYHLRDRIKGRIKELKTPLS